MWSLATLVLIVGMVFAPLRAAAAIPVLIAHDAANVRTARLAALTLGRCELRTASKYAYDEIPAAYDHQSNPRVMPGVAVIQGRTAPSKAPAGARCTSDDALYDAPSAMTAAEGLVASDGINGARLANQLIREEASSAFTATGELSSEAIQGARQLPINLGNPQIPAGFSKFSTGTFGSPSGPFQVHFYMNPTTSEVFYGLDYKAIFNNGVQPFRAFTGSAP